MRSRGSLRVGNVDVERGQGVGKPTLKVTNYSQARDLQECGGRDDEVIFSLAEDDRGGAHTISTSRG